MPDNVDDILGSWAGGDQAIGPLPWIGLAKVRASSPMDVSDRPTSGWHPGDHRRYDRSPAAFQFPGRLPMVETESEQRRRIRADLERRLDDLPVLPAVAAKIAALDPASTEFSNRVEEMARLDPTLTARLLRLSDRRLDQPGSVSEAIARVGARRLAETITSFAVLRVFIPATIGQRNLWIHALGVAITARTIAQLASGPWRLPPERAYLAGLMHDLGRFVMYDRDSAELAQVDETHWTSPAELVAAEIKICGFDHAFLGGLACQAWRFPDDVTTLVREHHVYGHEPKASGNDDVTRLGRILQSADMVNIAVLTRPDWLTTNEKEKTSMLEGLRRRVGWSETGTPYHAPALAGEIGRIHADCTRLAALLGLVAPAAA